MMLNSLLKINNRFFVLVLMALSSERALGYDFEAVYQGALKNSTDLAIVKANTDEAKALHNAANSNFMPRAGVESRYESFDSRAEKIDGGTTNAYLEWNVFNGFKDVKNRKSLGADFKAADLEKQRYEMNLRWIAMAKYTKAQAMQENVETYKRIIQSNLKNLETVRVRRSSGKLSEADYLEFELFDSKLKQDLMFLETEAAAATAELESFSGLSPIGALTTTLSPKALKLDDLQLTELLKSEKSQIYQGQLKVDAAEARKDLARGDYLPKLNLNATYGNQGIRETPDSPETTVGVTARWELFSGLETLNSQRVANAQLAKAKAEFDNHRIHSYNRAAQLKNLLNSLWTRFDFEEKNQKNIERFLKTVQDEYRRGAKNSNDLKSALELILETQVNRASLRSDYYAARVELQGILGIELKEL